jgi:carboxyl-terminal processing protease
MSSRTRFVVMTITAPVIAFAILGAVLGKVMAREETYQHLKVFDDVLNMITNYYVDPVKVDKVMKGAMHGLADTLDPDSAYLTADEVKQVESGAPPPAGDVGVELTRQYYLRIVTTRDASPAAKAGLRTGDYVRAIGEMPTRDMTVWEGMRAMRGAPGSKVKLTIIRGNAADPHTIELTREALPPLDVTSRTPSAGVGYVRIPFIGSRTVEQTKSHVADLARGGATKLIVDVRRTSTGTFEEGLALARLFIAQGTLAMRETKGAERETFAAKPGDGAIALPLVLLVDTGTSGAAELFASAVNGNKRGELIGERTLGRAGIQRLIKLPDGSGLWLTTSRYLTPAGNPLHEKGLEPTLAVESPDVEFGQPAPSIDPPLDKAIERLAEKKAA